MKATKAVFGVVLAGLLAACSSTEPEYVPAELTPITEKFEPRTLWRAKSSKGVEAYDSQLAPAIAGDKVFFANRRGEIYAVDLERGKRIWTQNVALYDEEAWLKFWSDSRSARLSGGITAANNRLFIGSENAQIYALDAETGDLAWQKEVSGEVLAAPVASAGLLLVNTSAGQLLALDAETGDQVWQFEQSVPTLTVRGTATPASSQGAVVLGQSNGKVAAMTALEGRVFWEQRVAVPSGSTELKRLVDIISQPVIIGVAVYVASYNGDLVALDLRNGEEKWRSNFSSVKNLAWDQSNLYLTDLKSHVHAVDRFTGRKLWSQEGLAYRDVTAPVVIEDYLVLGDSDGYLHWLDREYGEFAARVSLHRSGIYTAPVVQEKVLLVPTRNGQLTALIMP